MADIIKLLPDSIANQIAAGEVIQRPASVVKELLENSVDAGAKHIQLIVKDSGKTLIQVVDDGKGMTETDARMSLERHATSKIRSAEDLFHLSTMGFRGEALASISAVAQFDIKTRAIGSDIGTHLVVEASTVKEQEICATPVGTTMAIKNLFFNLPARRKFLKSDPVEMRHIIDEFERVALVNEHVEFKLYHNDQELFFLPIGTKRQRIINVLGKSYNEKLVPVDESTDIVNISGFVGKPESARKGRGEQFLFVNNRFFRSGYYHSAIQNAFEGLIPSGFHPSYFIYLEVDPESIDVNIHPTKTEIKFEQEKAIYAFLRSAVKRSLGQYHVAPSLDFDLETAFDVVPLRKDQEVKMPTIEVDPEYNPFESTERKPRQSNSDWASGQRFQKPMTQNWESLYENLNTMATPDEQIQKLELSGSDDQTKVRQIGLRYILVQSEDGIFLLHQYRAHARILLEDFETSLSDHPQGSQQELFPSTLDLSSQDAALMASVMPTLDKIGFQIELFGQHSFIIRGIPSACIELNIEDTLLGFINDLKENKPTDDAQLRDRIVRSMAQQTAIKSGRTLKAQEMLAMFRNLMRCKQPQYDLNGKPTFVLLNSGTLDKLFEA
ncbi:MAG: DNA mismatch repair endonuclease MutL [Salibacteraceae bacterium]|jgi:DNA mismatch repair protein MutL|nr:DNA mismatch repair endonuclease MutL [Salibacteraceae bacterium]MDP4687547.1 DNA mismatch repair endonuclease MutL [Salibacteraceae bacterium]MDP4764010.1 DNA mismatch repair endonuclease MutL [Salibacteraceae bacterium]MDP4845318.1 DNA mismatch repair endonuclease MutL [Salibacteraceae bacterium]